MTPKKPKRVFISHSTKDREFVEREIIPLLKSQGIEIWYSKDDIHGASYWESVIVDGLKSCDWFLVALSPAAVSSRWVRAELNWAFEERTDQLVPVVIQDCNWQEFNLLLRTIQLVDYSGDIQIARTHLLNIWGLKAPIKEELSPERAARADRSNQSLVKGKASLDCALGNASQPPQNVLKPVADERSRSHLADAMSGHQRQRGYFVCGVGVVFIVVIAAFFLTSHGHLTPSVPTLSPSHGHGDPKPDDPTSSPSHEISDQKHETGIRNGNFSEGLAGWVKEGGATRFRSFKFPTGVHGMTTAGVDGDHPLTGRLYQEFVVPDDADKLEFCIHGLTDPKLYVALRAGGAELFRQHAFNDNKPVRVQWNVSHWRGKRVKLEIVDMDIGKQHFIGTHGFRFILEHDDN